MSNPDYIDNYVPERRAAFPRKNQCHSSRARFNESTERGVNRLPSILSLWSSGSVLSIGSKNSVLSIGSVGSFGSFASIGSFASVLSIGSAVSIATVMSWLSIAAVMQSKRNGLRQFRSRQ